MKFEANHLRETTSESDSTTKDKKKNRAGAPPTITPESVRALARPAVSLESLVSEKPTAASEKSEEPAVNLTEMLVSKSSEKDEKGKESAENDTSVENLDATERQKVAEAYVTAVTPEVAAEVTDAKEASAEQVEAAANLALLGELHARLSADMPPEEALEDAYKSVAQTLETPTEAAPTSEFTTEAALEEADAGEEIAEVVSEEVFPESNAPVRVREAEYVHIMPSSDDAEAATASTTGGGPTPPLRPPKPPAYSGGGASGGGGGSSHYARFASGPSGATYARNPNANVPLPIPGERVIFQPESQARGLLVGGILGYLIGRRRGRIKTEKRLLPVQKKLEKQVKDLHEKISVKEQQIRTLAHQKAETETVARKRQELVRQLKKEHVAPSPAAAERTKTTPVAEVAAHATERPLAAGETLQAAKAIAEKPAQKIEEMDLAALLTVAESITVDKQPLRKMYESGQLDERSLRRAVSEHIRGGNVHEAVAREMVAKQLSFESDPRLRQAAAKAATPLAGAASAATATGADHDRSVLPNPMTGPATNPAYKDTAGLPHTQQQSSSTAIAVIVVVALALAVAALII